MRPERPYHQKDGCPDKIDFPCRSALLEIADIRPGTSENSFAADPAVLRRSCRCLRVRSVASRSFQATIGYQELAGRNGRASREIRVVPNSGIIPEFLCSQGTAAVPQP